jgi:hypothetical protein
MSDPNGTLPEHHDAVVRPWTVTIAATIAFVAAAACFLGPLSIVVDLIWTESSSTRIMQLIFDIYYFSWFFYFVFGGLLAWGGTRAFKGVTSKILFFTALAVVLLETPPAIYDLAVAPPVYGHAGTTLRELAGIIITIILPVIIVVLLTARPSRNFFHVRGGTTI